MKRISALVVFATACAAKPPPPTEPAARSPAPIAGLHDAWVGAVTAKDTARVESMLGLPVWVYYDDGVTSVPHPACARWRRTLRQAVTPADRTEVATCIVATAVHEPAADPTHPTGVVSLAQLAPFVPAPSKPRVDALGGDHVFVHGHSFFSSGFDFTLAVPRGGGAADLVIVTSEPGE